MIPPPACLVVPHSLDGHAPSVADQAAEAVSTLHTLRVLMRWLCALLTAQLALAIVAAVYWLTPFGREAAALAEMMAWP